jgi:hypothetical protein
MKGFSLAKKKTPFQVREGSGLHANGAGRMRLCELAGPGSGNGSRRSWLQPITSDPRYSDCRARDQLAAPT